MHDGPAVAIVGGGIIGASIAWRLAQLGARVTVYEAGRIGNESSWAGAGMLAPGGEFDVKSFWSEFALESLNRYPGFVQELEEFSGVSIDYRKCGAFDVAFSDAEAEALRERASRQLASGIYSEQFPPFRIRGLRQGAVAAQYFPNDAVVNPRDVMSGLKEACLRTGVQLREFSRVKDVRSLVGFEAIVISAGAWSSGITTGLEENGARLPVSIPVRGHLVAFEEETGIGDPILRHGHTYLLRRANNVLIAGASTEHAGFSKIIDGDIAAGVAAQAGQLIPALAGRPYWTWNGLRPGTLSGEPAMGRLGESDVWLAYGHYRNGILFASATAERIAREILKVKLKPASLQTGSLSPAGRQL